VCDAQGVEHRVKLRAKSVYEAALRGLERLQRADWSCEEILGDDRLVTVEVWEEPTISLPPSEKAEAMAGSAWAHAAG